VQAEARLRDAKPFGGATEMQLLGDRDEEAEVAQIERVIHPDSDINRAQ
jgi:hypothetical protein